MPVDPVDALLDDLAGRGAPWPPRRHADAFREARSWRAFLESDRELLAIQADWSPDRPYKIDPLPELIADAWADHLFGEDLGITPANPNDEGNLELMLEANDGLTDILHAAERENVAEGEKWWRVLADPELADAPLLDWHSRDSVLPVFTGPRLRAAALVTELAAPDTGKGSRSVWRHLEIHADLRVVHVLFRGHRSRLGTPVPLEQHPELEELAGLLGASNGDGQEWTHGLPMLMGYVRNRRPKRGRLIGTSDYDGITDYLLDLNEAVTIGAENARLTAKRRMVITEDALRPQGPELEDRGDGFLVPRAGRTAGFDAGDDVLVVSKLDAELNAAGDGPMKVLEYSYDAEALIAHKRDLVESAVTRRGLTPRYIGVANGEAPGVLSGTAYRLSLIPTTKAGHGKARPWDATLPHVLSLMAQVDALSENEGGFGRSWADPTTHPTVERPDALPRDPVEDAQVEGVLVGAGVRSKRTSVKAQHPEWTDAQVDEELDQIKADRAAGGGLTGLGLS